MIYIEKGKEPDSLTRYRQKEFAYFDGCNKSDIRKKLLEEQGSLCAYCMRRITETSMKIEHWYPEEQLTDVQKLDYSNMLGCCEGHLEGKKFRDDICDAHKGNTVITVNPTDERTVRQIAYKPATGEIYSPNEDIQKDLNIVLNLNCEAFYLKENRRTFLDEVIRKLSSLQKEGMWNKKVLQKVLKWCRDPDAHGRKKEYAGIAIWYIEQKLQ